MSNVLSGYKLRKGMDGSYSSEICIPKEHSIRFSGMTEDPTKMAEKGVVPGLYIDSVVAAAFDAALGQNNMPRAIVSMHSSFKNYFMAGATARFSFSPGKSIKSELCIAESGSPLCEVAFQYGEPVESHTRIQSLENMPGMKEYFISVDDLKEFFRMTKGAKEAMYPLPMLALSYFSNAAAAAVTKGDEMEPVVKFVNAGPLTTWEYEMQEAHHPKSEEPKFDGLEMLADLANECFTEGTAVYTSNSATFFKGAYYLKPSSPFRIYVDFSGLKTVRSNDGKRISGVKGHIKGEAVLSNGERLFECSAGILARKNK